MRILVADDSQTNLALLTVALHKLGHEVIPASNGLQAIDVFKHQHPDLIILDVVMEGIDGFETAKRIRAINAIDWIPIIFLSASVDDASIAKGIDAGGDDYLTKPFSEITLAAKIKAMQRIADMRRDLYETTQKLYLLSSTDVLTGAYNRLQFNKSLQEIIANADRHHHKVALLFIDLDDFKNVNDTYGHHIGDLLLIEVSIRLKSCIRENDFLARLGGDEFAIILKEISDEEEAGNVAEKIIDAISRDFVLENHTIRHSASIGIAIYSDALSIDKKKLVHNADIAMYHAKESGRNNFKFFSNELNKKYKKNTNLEAALKFAQENDELFITYQPIFALQTKELIGVETVVNWEHAKYGVIPHSTFNSIAEKIGLMPKIGYWMLRQLCEHSINWPLDNYNIFKFFISISPAQLLDKHFLIEIEQLAKYTKLSPRRLELELTESTLIFKSSTSINNILQSLHDMGISIAIKDFGTGFSSLSRLKKLKVDTLKIEKSFIEDIYTNKNSEIIVSTLISLGKNMNLNVIAEGIQNEQQLTYLINKGCYQGQGPYLCDPLSSTEMGKYFAREEKKLHPEAPIL